MASMKITSTGLDRMELFFDENSKTPVKYLAELDLELQKTLLKAKGLTHVITGRLKASGRANSDWSGMTDTWTGTITFGGPEFGVDYAIFEQDRKVSWSWRHGAVVNHDFMSPVYESEINFERIMFSDRMNSSWSK